MGFGARVCQASTLRMLICPEASSAQNNIAAVLLRNDWLLSLIGALLCRLGCGRGAPRDRALPGGLLGGGEVVRRGGGPRHPEGPIPKPQRKQKAGPPPPPRTPQKYRVPPPLRPPPLRPRRLPGPKH